ncbi:RNA-binding protein PNO1 [Tieghemostelium lacteum]|uniref:RNA-binding protein PNO1 n=1 Tax=Tieghemostelium lacteum TaxID=361077 RepID=A0A151Z5B3_TIELA|nr:RNA-binding protein PNO1 [Tieghemostelium lacteum]|eukprot:KYQ89131.1 RNA-binding protein PNO1 [Tieghemostelium lacteum]
MATEVKPSTIVNVITEDSINKENQKKKAQKRGREDEDMEDLDDNLNEPNKKPSFPQITIEDSGESQIRKISIPYNRLAPLKSCWQQIYEPIVNHLKLQIRMNLKTRKVEIKTSDQTKDPNAIQKASDFVHAFSLGFEVNDAVALLRLDDLFIDSFDVEDVKILKGDNLSRAIGRVAGKDGKTKFTIENVTKTRIVLADKRVHILGSYSNIRVAKDAICDLVIGSPPGKVYAKLKTIASRIQERF